MSRRIAALVLPELACEIARARKPAVREGEGEGEGQARPMVVLLDERAPGPGELGPRARRTRAIDAVSAAARRLGLRPGQGVAEASALVAELDVQHVTWAEIEGALERVADVALAFGPTAATRLAREDLRAAAARARQRGAAGVVAAGASAARTARAGGRDVVLGAQSRAAQRARAKKGDGAAALAREPNGDEPFDTVWLDVRGVAHLWGGEDALLEALCARVRALGHEVRGAIAAGPVLARCFARTGSREPADLPLALVPVEADARAFFARVGLATVGALAKLPRASVAARLGPRAAEVLALAQGFDPRPLVPHVPPRELAEEADFEDGVASSEALVFVARGMVSRLAARLAGRGEAALRLEVRARYDAGVLALEHAHAHSRASAFFEARIELPAPLFAEADLLRPLRVALEKAELLAPVVSFAVRIPRLVPAPRVQLDLARQSGASPDALPALLAELLAELGPERVGVLVAQSAQKPEARSRLEPPSLEPRRHVPDPFADAAALAARAGDLVAPARLLPEPWALGDADELAPGRAVVIDGRLFVVRALAFAARLEGVEWWTESPTSRDYLRALLEARGPRGAAEPDFATAWLFVDRTTNRAFVHGFDE